MRLRGAKRAAGWSLVSAMLVAVLPGCASSGAFLASPDDYAAYRATRVSRTLDGRLAAASTYLTRFPQGAFVAEVRAYLDRAEPIYYAAKRGSMAGLEAYLQVLPAGEFSKDAARRLRGFVKVRDSGDLLARAASQAEARIAKEQAERRRVREELTVWLDRFLDTSLWGQPLAEAPAELLVPFSVSLPAPVCRRLDDPATTEAFGAAPAGWPPGALLCSKLLELPYVVKVDGASEPRQATIEIAVIEDAAGRPLQVSIGGPDLFARLEETRTVHPVEAEDAAGRISGISQAVELARAAFRERVAADPACVRQAVAPVVLDLECKGARFVVRAAVDAGGDDAFTFTPAR